MIKMIAAVQYSTSRDRPVRDNAILIMILSIEKKRPHAASIWCDGAFPPIVFLTHGETKMSSKHLSIKVIASAVIIAFSATVVPIVPVSAALINNDRVAQTQAMKGDRAIVNEFMNRADVRMKFEALGVNPSEANLRVAALSDDEVAKLAEQIKSAPAGQSALGSLVGAMVLIFIVLLITDLLGFTSVFGFTRKGSANPT
jgi:hypothetical protein